MRTIPMPMAYMSGHGEALISGPFFLGILTGAVVAIAILLFVNWLLWEKYK